MPGKERARNCRCIPLMTTHDYDDSVGDLVSIPEVGVREEGLPVNEKH